MEKLIVKGARQHNLKNITVEIPRNKMVVITGLSGSGKSSLAFNTIYAVRQAYRAAERAADSRKGAGAAAGKPLYGDGTAGAGAQG